MQLCVPSSSSQGLYKDLEGLFGAQEIRNPLRVSDARIPLVQGSPKKLAHLVLGQAASLQVPFSPELRLALEDT